jgi:Skp family chaperone for outer membrane proteins
MTEWRQRLQQLVTELEQERDELRLKMHLAKADAKDELAKLDTQLDAKLAELKAKVATFDKDGDGSVMDDLGDAAKSLASDLQDGFRKFRERF